PHARPDLICPTPPAKAQRARFDTKTAMRAKSKFRCGIRAITPVQWCREKHSSFAFSETAFSCPHPALMRGALRGRHER
ncbi:hypothetical protein, partial [Bradyrhizobium sp.]|uniref:hypothetical protein n=1 Tax=Bradyrhizobium sp. TaxID=376 RepID=UPI002901E615